MTIASDLISINTTKGNIKTAIEAKGVTVGTVPFADYPSKIASITTSAAAEWTQAYYESVQATADAAVTAAAWVRPADWLAMPTVSATEQKFVGLYPVFDSPNNWVALSATGAYTVDWGDGTVQNFANNAIASRNYTYANISDTTQSSRGYRQVLITITPQAGQTLSNINLQQRPTGFANTFSNNWLDIVVAMNNTGTMVVGSSANLGGNAPRMLERFVWQGTNAQTGFNGFFYFCKKLQSITMNTANGLNFNSMFYGCDNLVTIPLLNTANGTDFQAMFYNCTNLITIPLINVGKAQTFNTMFQFCTNLLTVPLLDISGTVSKISTAFVNMFSSCFMLRTLPQLNFDKILNLSSAFSSCRNLQHFPDITAPICINFSNMFSSCFSLESVGNITATATASTTFSGMFQTCTSLTSVKSITTGTGLTSVSSMFNGCRELLEVPLFNTQNVTDMSSFLNGCLALTQIPLFNTQNVTNMDSTFYGCNLITTIPAFNTIKVANMSNCFRECYNLETVPEFNTVALTNAGNIFYNCNSLKSIHTIGSTLLTSVGTAFYQCYSLKTVTLNCNSTYIDSFQNCYSLETATIVNYSTSQAINATQTFTLCSSLKEATFSLPGGGKHTTSSVQTFQFSGIRKITGFDIASTTTTLATSVFGTCADLATVTLPGIVATFTVANCALGKQALVDLFTSLGTATAKTVTITGNWGAALLTTEDRAIATGKGFTIVG